jgi:GDP-mannose pyrophosphatase NudK
MTKYSTPQTKIKIQSEEILANEWSTLSKFTYDYTLPDGSVQTQVRESYNRGNGMTALLYDPERKTVLLIRQFRLPTYINGNQSGLLIETCAGKLENEKAISGMIREIEEETGHRVSDIEKVFEAYMSPGSVTELIHFYVAKYSSQTKVSRGGGLISEQENIEVLEFSLDEAIALIKSGEIRDGKTIMLLQYAKMNQLL